MGGQLLLENTEVIKNYSKLNIVDFCNLITHLII